MSETEAVRDVKREVEEPPVDLAFIDEVIGRYGGKADYTLQMLLDINNEFNYLPEEALRHLGDKVGMPQVQVYSLATFFKAFSLEPRGRHIISMCLGTACHVKGGAQIAKRLTRDLGIEDGETTEDMRYSLSSVRCLGACALAPVMVIDGETHSKLTVDDLPDILDGYE